MSKETCLGCLKTFESLNTVHTYSVGEYKKRKVRYCAACRKEFEAAFIPAGGSTPDHSDSGGEQFGGTAIPTPGGTISDFYKDRVEELEARGLSDAEICAELDRTTNIANFVLWALGS